MALAALGAPGCIQHRLDVTIRTDVRADGSCTRRVEYRLERTADERDRNDRPPGYRKDPANDPLRAFFRFPAGEPWTVSNEVQSDDKHTVEAEATFASVNDIDWDYWRLRAPAGRPARNYISFAQTTSAGSSSLYEYNETFRDPASPIAAARRLTELIQNKDKAFADAFVRALGDEHRDRGPLRHAFKDVLALPLARRVEALAARPTFGPHERKQLDRLTDEGPVQDFALALRALVPGLDADAVDKAAETALTEVFEPIQKDMDTTGLPVALALGNDPADIEIHFKVTLVMPAAITRANTCFTGDTATWEFDQDDLYSGPFPMWAKAGTP